MSISRPLVTAAVAAAALVAGLTSAPAGASPAYDPLPVKAGADWLTGQLSDGLVNNEQYQFDDYGLSIDVALGLHAADRSPKAVRKITRRIAANVRSYTTYQSSSHLDVFAGATAKAALLAETQGRNPRAFGGLDLVAQLEARVARLGPITGRIEDDYDPTDSSSGDFANVVGQAYAARALTLAHSAEAGPGTAFLLQQQCAKGYFRLYFTTDKTRADQSCQGAPRSERGASTDSTAQAVLALKGIGGRPAKAAVKRAVAWLVDHQRADGGFSDNGRSSGAVNSNSTGLAGWALGVSGSHQHAAKAAAFVRSLQVPGTNPCAGRLSGEAGAIAYDDTAYGTAQGSGIKKRDSDQWRRASAQALVVLGAAPRATGGFSASAAPTVHAGQTFRIRLTGVAPGERVCVSGAGSTYEFPGRVRPTTQVSFAVPRGPVTRTYRVWLGSHHRDVSVRITG